MKKWAVIISGSAWGTEVLGIVDAIDEAHALIKAHNIYDNGSVKRLLATEADDLNVRLIWQPEITRQYFTDHTSEAMKMSEIAPVVIVNEKGVRTASISCPVDKLPSFDMLEELDKLMKKEIIPFLSSLDSGWDCDTGANGTHPSYCRVCAAKKLLDKIKSIKYEG